MIVVAFILFALLVVAWLMAPSGEKAVKPAKAQQPVMTASGSPAD